MENKHLIMGTAGHVDHGKTSLIQALTGFDCDTHKQEKQRGITINLGFTNMLLPSGNTVGIVDVPGHADFINTMVSGACGIDFVLLVIAADEGIMPQTREHLQIMELLGIKRGIIALNKTDLVEDELVELAEEEARETVSRTFLQDSPLVRVSSLSGAGIDKLRKTIDDMVTDLPGRTSAGNFRMFIDRIFTVEGFGVVVNGSILEGKASLNDTLYLLPGAREVRIRRLERHGSKVDSIQAGDRAALNLAGFKQKEFRKGLLLSSRNFKPTRLLDARLKLFSTEIVLPLWSQVIFLLGTTRQMVRMHLLDKETLSAGEEGLVQIYLPQEIPAVLGDRFIIRRSSGDETLGGGSVIDPYPLHHRRRRQKQIEIVKKLSSGEISEIVAAEVRKSIYPLSLLSISQEILQPADKLSEIIYDKMPPDLVFYQDSDDIILLQKKQKTLFQNKIISSLQNYHAQNPLLETGCSLAELQGIFGSAVDETCRKFLLLLLQEMEESFKLRHVNKTWILNDHKVEISGDFQNKINIISSWLHQQAFNVPLISELNEEAARNAISEKEKKLILQKLLRDEEIIYYQESYIHSEIIKQARSKLVAYLKQNEQGIKLSEYRDLLQTNRKMATLLLEYFDKKQITQRHDNIRHFTPLYKKYLKS